MQKNACIVVCPRYLDILHQHILLSQSLLLEIHLVLHAFYLPR